MKRVLMIFVLLILAVSMMPLSSLQVRNVLYANAQSTSEIIVQVNDQNGLFYNGVQVQIWQQSGSLLYSGTTANGYFSSGDLPTYSNYLVIVNSGFQSENQTVFVGTTNTLAKFVLTRPPSPVLSVTGVNFTPSVISPGSTFVAQITTQSSTSSAAYYASISFNSSSPSGVSVSSTGSILNLGTVAGNSSLESNVTFVVQDTALTGTYQVPYTLTYDDATGNSFTTNGYISVPVTGVPSRPVLIISNVTFNPVVISPGSSFTTYVNVTNTGSQPAYAASLGITIPGQTISLIGNTGQFNMGVLPANSSRIVSFQMGSQFNAQSGAVAVDFTLLYNNKLGTVFGSNGTFSVFLSATPDLQVQSFSLSNSLLVPGGTSDLIISVLNAGGDTAYGVSLNLQGNQFLSGNSSNYLGAVLSQGTGKAVFVLDIANNTLPGNYNFTVAMKYTDIEGRSYSSVNNYSLTVAPYPPPSVSVTNVMVNPPVLLTGTSGSITLFFENFGVSTADNVTVQVVGGDGIVSSNYFGLGTINTGGQVTQVIGVNVGPNVTPGNHALIFNVTYSDATGKVYHSSVPMNVSVYDSPNLFSTKNILIVAGVLILVLVGGLFLRKRKII